MKVTVTFDISPEEMLELMGGDKVLEIQQKIGTQVAQNITEQMIPKMTETMMAQFTNSPFNFANQFLSK